MAKPNISNAFAIAGQSQIFLPPVQHCLSPLALNFNSCTVYAVLYRTEFRSQESEFRMNSVRLVDE
ncbi:MULTISPECIES: hypothetical protein [unclassified Nostoc]|uniref:hypothetical protein n=1 Tax=unclassified Nostoc TaxID=2593658 RepID=UPI002606AF11|nr:hypothetical protein [Nostoc sp. S13]MDF5740129.1 hypothetical protein [Nostoc sp. S13]